VGKRIKDGLIGAASSGAIAIQHVVVPSHLTCHRSGHHCSSGRYSFCVGVTRLIHAGLFAILQTMQREHWV